MDNKVRVALAGNPNVGKSTLFNLLTGLKQHTGNWAGKTVENATGYFKYKDRIFEITDLPGTYSLMAHSPEEEIARDFICLEKPDITVIVCDCSLLERNLNLAIQAMEITDNVILVLNLADEARKRKITVDEKRLSELLSCPVVKMSARNKEGLKEFYDTLYKAVDNTLPCFNPRYTRDIENAISGFLSLNSPPPEINSRFYALRCLSEDMGFNKNNTDEILAQNNLTLQKLRDNIISCIFLTAEGICSECVTANKGKKAESRADKILTGKITAVPIMILMLMIILWLTVNGANYPSSLLSQLFTKGEILVSGFLSDINCSDIINSLICEGIIRVTGWVVAVMLPPMAVFFPLFTLLEDGGILPRIAFNLDGALKKAHSCGKQALSMCMSLGCNACGVTGARIIDSKRERLCAILTSAFIPCNGKFPTLISIISMFLITGAGVFEGMAKALGLTLVLIVSVGASLFATKLLSLTILKGEPSSFALELPPYRMPKIEKVLVRSLFDRTVKILLRAVIVSAPAGLVIWLLANLSINDISLLSYCTGAFDGIGGIMGLDGVILFAFILGFPANEIVVPIIIMSYIEGGSIAELSGNDALRELLINNGWSIKTAVCMLCFTMFHFPCSTTCITIYKETKKISYTLLSIVLPTALGIALCVILNCALSLLGL